jgi:acetyltransferase-like isoleucine patch superfamily enzyme
MTGSAQQAPLPDDAGKGDTLLARLKNAWQIEFSGLRWRLMFCMLLARLLPSGRAFAWRAALMRTIGASIGAGTRISGMPKLQSQPSGSWKYRLKIGADCTIGSRVILEFGESLSIGDRTTLGDGAVVLTTTHQLGPREHRAGEVVRHPVVIGNDVVIGEDAIVLPGVTVGDGARVLPNSVVNGNVAPGITVSGVPARPLRAP